MLSLILGYLATIVVALILVAIVTLIIIYIVRSRKKGNFCGSGCAGCSMADKCGNKNKK